MSEIEVEEYVRTDKGYIFNNLSSRQISGLKLLSPQYGNIVKHSKNILDLIKVGDFVNGYKVTDYDLDYFNGNDRREEPKRFAIIVDKFCNNHIKEDEIETILTKEQMEANKYVVKWRMKRYKRFRGIVSNK